MTCDVAVGRREYDPNVSKKLDSFAVENEFSGSAVTKSEQTMCNQPFVRGKIDNMASRLFGFAVLGLALSAWAQQGKPSDKNEFPASQSNSQESTRPAPPRSDRVQAEDLGSDVGESSSKETRVDLSPPEDDAKAHPNSSAAVAEAQAEVLGGKSGVTEFHTWDPHKAAKSIEVGNFYFKRGNYRAAEDRAFSRALPRVARSRFERVFEPLRWLTDGRRAGGNRRQRADGRSQRCRRDRSLVLRP